MVCGSAPPDSLEGLLDDVARRADEPAELAAGGEPLAAVDGDALAGDEGCGVGYEERGEVGELVMFAEAAGRDAGPGLLLELGGGQEPLPGALGREGPGRDGVDADPVGRPFHGEGAGHGEDAGLGRGG